MQDLKSQSLKNQVKLNLENSSQFQPNFLSELKKDPGLPKLPKLTKKVKDRATSASVCLEMCSVLFGSHILAL